ncbi:unnamed protein product [Cunninghamella echinulata]
MFAFRRVAISIPHISRPLVSKNIPYASKSLLNASPLRNNLWCGFSTSSVNKLAFVQKPAPEFTAPAVVDGQFKDISLKDYKGKYVVLFWYPLDFTFVCPTEIIAFSDRVQEFEALDTAVIGASCDSEFSHLAWINTPRKQGGLGGLNIPLLADKTKSIAKDYGVLLKEAGVPLRGLFIIDPKGIVRQITINDLPVGRSVDEVLRLVKAFKFTDEHGEVCPANWNQGDKTIKPTVSESKEYFGTVNE